MNKNNIKRYHEMHSHFINSYLINLSSRPAICINLVNNLILSRLKELLKLITSSF